MKHTELILQPLGRKPSKFPNKTDCHPPKGYENWWEHEIGNGENKKGERQASKKDIKRIENEMEQK